jgi:hypothetical protein
MNEFYQKLQKYDQYIPNFEIAISGIGESYPTRPGVPKKLIRGTTENAFQGAIFLTTKIKIHLTNKLTIDFCLLDYEIPVILNSNSRRKSVDLISKSISGHQIHEVKYKYNRSKDSPFFAASEIIKYRHIISENYALLDKNNVYHRGEGFRNFAWKNLNENCQMYVIANEAYWEYWRKKRGETNFSEYLDLMASMHITCLSGKNVDFNSQKHQSENGSYIPHLPYNDFYQTST